NETNIIFNDPMSDDGYTNGTQATMQDENQKILNREIGNGNYDIGHVFGTGGGGRGDIGSVCANDRKGRGATCSSNPVGDAFDVDLVAHEMGHQFGANHTFNGSTSDCGPARTASAAYEPGSGSTIMG